MHLAALADERFYSLSSMIDSFSVPIYHSSLLYRGFGKEQLSRNIIFTGLANFFRIFSVP
jgi:hypothetical protein